MLPQMTNEQLFVTDAGLETDLIFNRGIELPEFASFVLIDDEAGKRALVDYYRAYYDIARERGAGFVLDTPTWRANRDWGERLGYDRVRLADANRGWGGEGAGTGRAAGAHGARGGLRGQRR